MAAAYAHELPAFGVKAGLTNYAAAYCTGLLCARRLLTKIGIAGKYAGLVEANGEMFQVEANAEGGRPFKANLDVGLRRTTTGARIFAVMKGAVDGGLFVPHSPSRFAGANAEGELDASVLRKYIFGGHVADYMRSLKEEDGERYQKQFSQFINAGIEADDMESMYKKAHENIRANPSASTPKRDLKPAAKKQRLTYEQRKERVQERIAAYEASRDQ